jgi:hypothetical protein
VCDLTHRLLACSPSRAAQFSRPLVDLMGQSLWRYATAEIRQVEAALDKTGWRENQAPPALQFSTGSNDSSLVPIPGWAPEKRDPDAVG